MTLEQALKEIERIAERYDRSMQALRAVAENAREKRKDADGETD